MVKDCVSKKILKDGSLLDAETVSIPDGAVVIYDVLRVMEQVPLFVEDHSARFFKSFDLSQRERPFAENVFADSIRAFISSYGLENGNVRCV